MSALVPAVVPWMMRPAPASSSSSESSKPRAASSIASKKLRARSSRVGTLPVRTVPDASMIAQSVNVPPMSTPTVNGASGMRRDRVEIEADVVPRFVAAAAELLREQRGAARAPVVAQHDLGVAELGRIGVEPRVERGRGMIAVARRELVVGRRRAERCGAARAGPDELVASARQVDAPGGAGEHDDRGLAH